MNLRVYGWSVLRAIRARKVAPGWQCLLMALAVSATACTLSGCSRQPYAAETNLALTVQERQQKQVFTSADARQAMAILESTAEGSRPIAPPAPAKQGLRWRDVPAAAGTACAEVEMVVVRRIDHDWGIEFQLLSVEEYPGTLNVRRRDDERVYEADAVVGVFGNHTGRAERLLKAFADSMIANGKKRRFEQEVFGQEDDGQ
jgi:hypothetical protein